MIEKVVNQKIVSDDNYSNVAWYKLAELIQRGEKEKALSFYKLLSHSFDEKAYSLQLEGDLLWYLEDKQALEKYVQAAFLYKKEKKFIEAVSIYEHLLTLEPENKDFLFEAAKFYVFLDWQQNFESKFFKLLDLLNRKVLNAIIILDVIKIIWSFTSDDSDRNEKINKSRKKWILNSLQNLSQNMPSTLAKSVKQIISN